MCVEPARDHTVPGAAMRELRAGTADLHHDLERRLASAERFTRRERYIEHLARLAGFHLVAEARWANLLLPVLPDFTARRKAGLLLRDLAHLGGEVHATAEVPAVSDSAAALGAFYVLEGATLGGQHLLVVVERKLGLDAEHGAAYLSSYGPAVRAMWEAFGHQVEQHCRDRDSTARAVAAARATFATLADCLCGVPA